MLAGISVLGLLVLGMTAALTWRLVKPPVDAVVEDESVRLTPGEVIQINVLNASGEAGIARKVMDFMRARGFDVVEIDNFKNHEDRSFVIDRIGDRSSARKVSYAMGIPDSLMRRDVDSTLYLRASVVIGRDFKTLKAFR
ncbi:MAG TPA: LytR C-terminal domain-containing protein [Patescibacteria group bacterium]|nr:LytR C-terminal domain-containing protein [Patescibacteria group bacterium]